jgi:hypothetical protein
MQATAGFAAWRAESVGSNSTALRPSADFTPASSAALNNAASCFSFFMPDSWVEDRCENAGGRSWM